MKRQEMQDERVAAQRRKINGEAFGILMIVLLASTLVQQFLLNAPFEQYAVETICFIGISFYVVIRYMTLGLDIFGDGKRAKTVPLVNSLVTGVIATVIHGILNAPRYAAHYADGIGYLIAATAIFFISVTLSTLAVLSGIGYLNKRKQAKIQRHLDEDEQA